MIKKNSYDNFLITNISGGLGNQLFCYYSSLSFANNRDISLYIDNYDYKFYRSDRGFLLNKFKIEYKIIDKKILKQFRYIPFSKLDYYFVKYFKINGHKTKQIIKEDKNDNFESVTTKIRKNSYLDGYWQNIDYLYNVKKIMQREIDLKQQNSTIKYLMNKISIHNSCSVHIRRGDYLSKPFNKIYNVCTEEYYQNAFKIIESRISNPLYFIFTDDINWSKLKLDNLNNKIFINDFNLNDYEEFFLLSKCKSHIISNSTFSFIGAWLNYQDNIIIEPDEWFKNMRSGNKLVKDWIKLQI